MGGIRLEDGSVKDVQFHGMSWSQGLSTNDPVTAGLGGLRTFSFPFPFFEVDLVASFRVWIAGLCAEIDAAIETAC